MTIVRKGVPDLREVKFGFLPKLMDTDERWRVPLALDII